jgi:hypothetical protein
MRRSVAAARKPVYPAVLHLPPQCIGNSFGWPAADRKTMVGQRGDEFGYRRRSVQSQVHGENITELDSVEA